MPPKPKFTKEEIVQTALEIVSQKGVDALTAKELGDALGSSARPIFTVFSSMKEVGMQMVLFGAREPKLYQLLFMQENRTAVSFDDIFGELGPTAETCIGLIQETYDMCETEARLLFENVWIYTFGVGTLCATRKCRFSEEALGQMLSTEFQAMMLLVKTQLGTAEQ